MNKQQKEALVYFKKSAKDWKRKEGANPESEVNIIKERNDFVLKVIDERKKTDSILDIGCGTGDLVCRAALKGIKSLGIDFADEMIKTAKKQADKLGAKKAKFECCSVFDFKQEADKYDVISANGFIEYISYKDLKRLLNLTRGFLKSGGSLVLGSRNRLFNIFSLNKFTEHEIRSGNAEFLLAEAIAVANLKNINGLMSQKTAPLQKENVKHDYTGIGVSTRYQFTPAQLAKLLKTYGFRPVEIFPIHIHGVTPAFKEKYPEIHASISNLLRSYAQNNTNLVPLSSSFMIHAKKI